MLVLTRNKGQRIYIGDDITVTVVDQSGGKTRLGIEAPDDIHIERDEVRARRLEADEHDSPTV
ncbi:carbon storage regulator [Zhongshania sp.]|uniref:carbon storage regulator n=1 Tax=Zhongshania sp. TaxID=1971902 RepID=UPI00356B2060